MSKPHPLLVVELEGNNYYRVIIITRQLFLRILTAHAIHLVMLCHVTQRQNECACSAFWRASGHFLVSGYDQKTIITEKAPVLCSS